MNRYPVWKYIIIVVAILLGALYTAPNYFGESPALQVTSGKSTVKMTSDMVARVTEALKKENIPNEGISYDGTGTYTSVRARFATPDIQFKAKSVLEKDLNTDANDPTYLVALNLQANTPQWMQSLHALPMYLGLDLRGGVHFLMQVDTKAALTKRVQGAQAATRSLLRDKNIRHAGIDRVGDTLEIKFRDDATRQQAKNEMSVSMGDFLFTDSGAGDDLKMVVSLKPTSTKEIIDQAVKQNIATLSKRVNELGVSEPVIQQQGADHRRAAAGRAGRGARQGRHRPHRYAGIAHGRRHHHAGHRADGHRAVQLRAAHRRQGRAGHRQQGRGAEWRLHLQRHRHLRREPAACRQPRTEWRRRPPQARRPPRTRGQAHGHRAVREKRQAGSAVGARIDSELGSKF